MKKFKIRYSYNLHVKAITKEIFFTNLSDAFLFLEKSFELFQSLDGPIIGPTLQEFKNNIWKDWCTDEGYSANYLLENDLIREGYFALATFEKEALVPEPNINILVKTKFGHSLIVKTFTINNTNETHFRTSLGPGDNAKYWRYI